MKINSNNKNLKGSWIDESSLSNFVCHTLLHAAKKIFVENNTRNNKVFNSTSFYGSIATFFHYQFYVIEVLIFISYCSKVYRLYLQYCFHMNKGS